MCVQCLRKDAESRRRELHIRTYAVIPLNEECGIIEWVNNTAALRHILTKLYKERGILHMAHMLRSESQPECGQMVTLACVFKVSTCRVKSSGSLFCQRLLPLRRSCVSTRRCCAHDTPLCFMSGSSGPFLIPHHGKTPISQLHL